jgi:sugar-specific transcriptional regulator TrmB
MTDTTENEEADEQAVTVLERLGLSNYEAQVFVALQRLGIGTAREIHEEIGVPRSQVYGAADDLEAKGLVSVQQSRPKRYRPIELEEARQQLTETFERDRQVAFEHLERIQSKQDRPDEQREDIWTTSGTEAIDTRVMSLLDAADRQIFLATDDSVYIPEEAFESARTFAANGGHVTLVSRNRALRERFEAAEMAAMSPPEQLLGQKTDRNARLYIIDDDTLLMSVLTNQNEEVAVWSSQTTFAQVFGSLLQQAVFTQSQAEIE